MSYHVHKFLPYLAMAKNPFKKSGLVTLTLTFDLWPWNCLDFERLSRHIFLQISSS